MLTIPGIETRYCDGITRRSCLQIGGLFSWNYSNVSRLNDGLCRTGRLSSVLFPIDQRLH